MGQNGKSSCGEGTLVVYYYDSSTNVKKYYRNSYDVKPGRGTVRSSDEVPGPYELGDFCAISCQRPGQHDVKGECVWCNNGYYWDDSSGGVCKKCPAGYACPFLSGEKFLTEPTPCPMDTFSEGGQPACTNCSTGYTTEGNTDWCLAGGSQCISRNACKKKSGVAKLCLDLDSGCFKFENGLVKILSTNRSVIQNK